jgi:pimeloyl-ACP methyl ester carboxylesterase
MSAQKSTIVRSIQVGFRFAESWAPGLGAIVAERMWLTPPQGRAAVMRDPGSARIVLVDGRKVVTESWGEGPVIYLVHGWGGRRSQLEPLIAPLTAAGHRVVAFDALSHGDSAAGPAGPKRATLPEFMRAINAVVAAYGPAHAIVAHSFGGTSSMLAILDGLAVGRVVSIAAMADPIPYTVEFARGLGFGERVRTGFLRRLEARVGRKMEDFSVPYRARRTADLPPLLVVHDREDKEVHFRDAVMLAGAWRGAELLATQGLGHRRILADPGVLSHVTAFVTGRGQGRGPGEHPGRGVDSADIDSAGIGSDSDELDRVGAGAAGAA